MADIRGEVGDQLAAELGPAAAAIRTDVAVERVVAAVADVVIDLFGRFGRDICQRSSVRSVWTDCPAEMSAGR